MTHHLLAFALIGLLVGVAARTFSPGGHAIRSLGTWVLGAVGALGGGLLSWSFLPAVENHIHLGNLLMAFLGAAFTIVATAGVAYARRNA
jgi:uncharacterized membrane protein YeaQ/YmgE (transglycosylase-associated protein family)